MRFDIHINSLMTPCAEGNDYQTYNYDYVDELQHIPNVLPIINQRGSNDFLPTPLPKLVTQTFTTEGTITEQKETTFQVK